MKSCFAVVVLSAASLFPLVSPAVSAADISQPSTRPAIAPHGAYGRLPLSFIRNDGQLDSTVQYFERGNGHTTLFTNDGVFFALGAGQTPGTELKLTPLAGNPNPTITAEGVQPGTVNYLRGNDPAKWITHVPTYRAVVYHEIYPGIDLKFYGNERRLEYDIIVGPGADPSRAHFAYGDIDALAITKNGDLEITHHNGKMIQKKPVIYQEIDGKRVDVQGAFKILDSPTEFGFEVAAYDRRYPLTIDPPLVYSTFIGGTDDDAGRGIAIDAAGNAYVIGISHSIDFPATAGAADQSFNGGSRDFIVTKLDPTGSALIYATYLGGTGDDFGEAIAVDAGGNAYLTGYTASSDFPTTAGAYNRTYNGGPNDAVVVKLSPTGSTLVYSTYLGGTGADFGHAIAVDAAGDAFVAGQAGLINFPGATEFNVYGDVNAFVIKLNPAGSALLYASLVGGDDKQWAQGLAIDAAGNAYVAGLTSSTTDFPVTAGAYDRTYNGGPNDAFVLKLNSTGTAILFASYLGGSGAEQNDAQISVALDANGNIYVSGSTGSIDFPTTPGVVQPAPTGGSPGSQHVFVSKFNPVGSTLLYSTYLAGSSVETSYALAVDAAGDAYVTGYTASSDFPVTAGAIQPSYGSGFDAYLSKLNPTGTALLYSTYLGGNNWDEGLGVVVDASGNAYLTGPASSIDFPTTPGAFSTTLHPGGFFVMDAFVAKLETSPDLIVSNVSTTTTSLDAGSSFALSNTVANQGVSTAGPSTVSFSLSLTGATDDVTLTPTRSAPSINVNATSPASTTLTIPAANPGDYHVCARADSGGVVVESNEGNNRTCTTATLTVTPIASPAPVVSSVSLSAVTYGITASRAITITGANFLNGSTITVGGLSGDTVTGTAATTAKPFVYISSTKLQYWWPNTALPAATYDVTVTLPASAGGAAGIRPSGFTVAAPQPTIGTLSPASVIYGITAGKSINIPGSNFVPGSTITIHETGGGTLSGATNWTGSPATAAKPFMYTSATSVKFWWDNVTLPPGSYAVTVTNPAAAGGKSATKTGGFVIVAPQPTISSLSVSSVTYGVTASKSITISGSNFVKGATITVGAIDGPTVQGTTATAAVRFVYSSGTSVKFWWNNTSLPAGTYDVTVTNPAAAGGLAATKPGGFVVH